MTTQEQSFAMLRQKASGNGEALDTIDRCQRAGASAEATALELFNTGAFGGSEAALTAVYQDNGKLQHEFGSLQTFLGFKRHQAKRAQRRAQFEGSR